jgi:hypothetical protein
LNNGKSDRRRPSWCGHSARKAEQPGRTPGRAQCAASTWDQSKKSAQSNQQDLIGEVETNRQQKPARRKAALLQGEVKRGGNVVQQRNDWHLLELQYGLGNSFARGANVGTPFALAILLAVMRMVRFAARTLTARPGALLGGNRLAPACAIVRVMCAASHHKVESDRHSREDLKQPVHTTFPQCKIRYRQ